MGQCWLPRGLPPRGSSQHCCYQCPVPVASPCGPTSLQETIQHCQDLVRLLWGHFSFPLGPGPCNILFVPSKSEVSISPSPMEVKSLWLSSQISGGLPVPMLDPHAGKSDAGLRTCTTVRELLILLLSSLWVTHLAGMRLGFIMIVSFLPSCHSFFFVFGCGVSFLVGCSILPLMGVQS